jgi:hypothetical protein
MTGTKDTKNAMQQMNVSFLVPLVSFVVISFPG